MAPITEALLQRIEGGFGRDKELDAEIEFRLPQSRVVTRMGFSKSVPGKLVHYYEGGTHGTFWPSDFTSSLDCAADLAKRLLPGWRVRVQVDGDGVCEAFVENKGDRGAIEARHTQSFASSPERALVAAVLRGWSMQQEARAA